MQVLLGLRRDNKRGFKLKTKKLILWLKIPYLVSLNCLVIKKLEKLLNVRLRLLVRNKLINFVKMLLSMLFLIFPPKKVFRLVPYMNRLILSVNLMKSRNICLIKMNHIILMKKIMTIYLKKIKRPYRFIINILRNQRLVRFAEKKMLLFLLLRKMVRRIFLNLQKIK